MPLDHGYGCVIGELRRFYREDPDNYGRYYHGYIDLNVNGEVYECAIDVDTHNNTITVEHRVVEIKSSDINELLSRNYGYYDLESNSDSGAIDYIRSSFLLPLRRIGCIPGIIISILPFEFKFREPNNESLWTKNNGAETLDVLESILNDGENLKLLIFGEPYNYGGKGLHNIHQNQGDPDENTTWWDENGIWQDGCTIIVKSDGRIFAFLNKFSSQAYQTNSDGHPII